MPYSLVSAATLGFDLVRLPAGRSVAEVLLAGLGADQAGLTRLAEAHPARGLDHEERLLLAVRSRRARELAVSVPNVRSVGGDHDRAEADAEAAAGAAAGAAATGRSAAERTAVLVEQLERSTLGDAPNLERLLRDDVLGPEHPAIGTLEPDTVNPEVGAEAGDVLADAAVGYWAAGVLPPLVRRELTAAFDSVQDKALDDGPLAGPFDLGPATADLHELFDRLRGLDEAGRARWRTAVDEGRAEHRPWATAMHEASWAAHVSGRTRALAAAQLLAVQAFVDAGFDGRDGAAGAWNAVAGCVQGLAMADLLDAGAVDVLRAPIARVTGPR